MRAVGAASTPGLHCLFLGLLSYPRNAINWGRGGLFTWPPEKPTATTPSSLLLDKNLGLMVEGEVMIPAAWEY